MLSVPTTGSGQPRSTRRAHAPCVALTHPAACNTHSLPLCLYRRCRPPYPRLRSNENERRTPPPFFESNESERLISPPALLGGVYAAACGRDTSTT